MKTFIKQLIIVVVLLRTVAYAQESPNFYWFYHVVDADAPVGVSTTLLYDQEGNPAIAYREDTVSGAIKFARFNGLSWDIEIVDRAVGFGKVAMAVDNAGTPHIIFHNNEGTELKHAFFDGQTWIVDLIDSSLRPSINYDLSIQIDSNGRVHIIYATIHPESQGRDNITYVYIDSTTISTPVRVDTSQVTTGKWNSLVLDSTGRPAVAYFTDSTGDLTFARLEQGIWRTEKIEESGNVIEQGYYASMRRDSQDNFYISFQNWNANKVRFAQGKPGSWSVEDIADLTGWTTFSTRSELALDQQANPYVAFEDSANGDLKIAYRRENTWHVETVDTVGFVGEYASIEINPQGLPAISYYDRTRGYLRLAVASLTPPSDSDGDGVPDYLELAKGTGELDRDSDDDGLSDGEEDLNHNGLVESYETDPGNPDTDGDGIQDGTEVGRITGISGSAGIEGTDLAKFIPDSDTTSFTNNRLFDTDGDGLGDGQEDVNFDGRVDTDESDPNKPDTDGDRLSDGVEAKWRTSAVDLDSDDDGLMDGDEDKNLDGILDADETHPGNPDTDGDGVADGTESGVWQLIADPDGTGRLRATDERLFQPDLDTTSVTNPRVADTDGDGLKDGAEDTNANGTIDFDETDPLNTDTDSDGVTDGKEVLSGFNPLDLDTDDDGLADGFEDANHNGTMDAGETSPTQFDTDGDGVGDGQENGLTEGIQDPDGTGHLQATDNAKFIADMDPGTHTKPLVWDTDDDGLADGEEDSNVNGRKDAAETDPLLADSDGDGVSDGDEVNFLADPLNASDVPALSVLLREDFSQANLDEWTVVDEGTIEGPSVWIVFDSSLVQSSNIYGGVDYTGVDDPNKPGTYIWRGSTGWKDYKLSFNMRSDDDDALGVMFRFSDSNNYYRFSMNREKQFVRVVRYSNGQPTILAKKEFEYEIGRWYPATVYVVGSRIQFYLDGRRIFDFGDGALKNGAIAFYSWRNAGSWFSDVQIIGTNTVVSVQSHIVSLMTEIVDQRRLIRWTLAGDSYDTIILERLEANQKVTLLESQKKEGAEKNGPFVFVDREPWLAVGYRVTMKNSAGQVLDYRELNVADEVIEDFVLSSAFPNPFYRQSNFVLQAPRPFEVRMKVFNILGQLIRENKATSLNKGWHQLAWDGMDDNDNPVPSGIYFVQVEITNNTASQVLNRFVQKVIKAR